MSQLYFAQLKCFNLSRWASSGWKASPKRLIVRFSATLGQRPTPFLGLAENSSEKHDLWLKLLLPSTLDVAKLTALGMLIPAIRNRRFRLRIQRAKTDLQATPAPVNHLEGCPQHGSRRRSPWKNLGFESGYTGLGVYIVQSVNRFELLLLSHRFQKRSRVRLSLRAGTLIGRLLPRSSIP